MKFELEPDNRNQPDAVLLDDLRVVAGKLGLQTLTQEQYDKHGRFSAATFKKRFGKWNSALTAASLSPAKLMNVPRDLLLEDLKRVAGLLGKARMTVQQYEDRGRYSSAVFERRFGSWNNAIALVGLEPANVLNITSDDLFDNLERVWRHLGRQPRITDLRRPLSKYSGATYKKRFGGFRKALEAFVSAIDDDAALEEQSTSVTSERPVPSSPMTPKRKTPRTAGWRLRFLTFRRDGYRCKACGKSPANEPGVELEVDHVVPWSDGGETVLENLQLLCQKCNGGKSNLDWEQQ